MRLWQERFLGLAGVIIMENNGVKKLFLTSIAALFLATGTAHARCMLRMKVTHCSERGSCMITIPCPKPLPPTPSQLREADELKSKLDQIELQLKRDRERGD